MRSTVLTLAAVALATLTGCGDKEPAYTKPGGGGRPQAYDGGTGRYTLVLGAAAACALLVWATAGRRRTAQLRTA